MQLSYNSYFLERSFLCFFLYFQTTKSEEWSRCLMPWLGGWTSPTVSPREQLNIFIYKTVLWIGIHIIWPEVDPQIWIRFQIKKKVEPQHFKTHPTEIIFSTWFGSYLFGGQWINYEQNHELLLHVSWGSHTFLREHKWFRPSPSFKKNTGANFCNVPTTKILVVGELKKSLIKLKNNLMKEFIFSFYLMI